MPTKKTSQKSTIIAKLTTVAIVGVMNCFIWFDVIEYHDSKGYLEIVVLDIGQGDAILIKTPNNYYNLIDGGNGKEIMYEFQQVISPLISKFGFVFGTHADFDHIGGLDETIQRYTPQYFFLAKSDKDSDAYTALVSDIKDRNITNAHINTLSDFSFDFVFFNVLWPEQTMDSQIDTNDQSYGLEIVFGNFEFITMGDLGSEYEISALQNRSNPDSDVLKLSHHGSKTSSDETVISAASAEVALISAGRDNSYGHPHEEVLETVENYEMDIYRTDRQGRIRIRTDGKTFYEIKTESNHNWIQYTLQ